MCVHDGLFIMQVYSFFAINLVQSVAFSSMRRLGLPVEIIAAYVETSMRNYGLRDANIDITQRPHQSVVMWLLDLGIEHSIYPNKKDMAIMKSMSTLESFGDSSYQDRPSESSPVITPACKHAAVGYSAILEVVFYLAGMLDKKSAMYKLLLKIRAEKAADKKASNSNKIQKYTLKCVCGMSLNEWKPLGLFDSSSVKLWGEKMCRREFMSYFLCEMCFRQSTCTVQEMGSVVNGGVGKSVVPLTVAEPAESFLCIFYGNHAARSGFQSTSGQHVRLHVLGNFAMSNVTFKKRAKVRKVDYFHVKIVRCFSFLTAYKFRGLK